MSALDTASSANEHGRRLALARFGYRASSQPDSDRSETWARLRSDFRCSAGVLDLSELKDDVLERAIAYCDHRASLDRLMDACDAIHLEILRTGPRPDLVEIYADARDRYEEAVEEFGALRASLQDALSAQAS